MAKAEKDEVYRPDGDLFDDNIIDVTPESIELEDIEELEENPGVSALTTKEQFEAEVAKLEYQIVQQFIYGASIDQLAKRYRQYTPNQINRLILETLSVKNYDADLGLGAGIFGFQDDLKALSEFIEEAPKGGAIKLHGIKIRSETREKMLKFMQSAKLLPTLTTVGEMMDRGGSSPASIEAEETSRKLKIEFETNTTPQQRLKMIEDLDKGQGN